MASFNVTVEDGSPLISYAPAGSWTDTPSNDSLASSYSGGSYHTSSDQGATATITFTGTGLFIFGGHRSNYGTYSLSVDGQVVTSGTSQSSDSSTRQLLGSVSGLSYGLHTAVLTNTGGNPIDIDSIDFEARVGPPGAVAVKKTIDDNDSRITYLPSTSAWQANQNSAFLDGTLHFSQTDGASASLTFEGDAVAVFGTVSPDHANIVMTLDSGNPQTLPGGSGGMASSLHPQASTRFLGIFSKIITESTQVLLWYASDLGSGQHTIVVSGQKDTNTGPFIDLDFINVFDGAVSDDPTSSASMVSGTAAAAALPTSSSTAAPSTESPVSKSRMSTGATVGAVLGGLIAFLFLLGILGFMFLRRRRTRSKAIEKSMISVSPILPMQRDPRAMEAGMMRSVENPVFPLPPPKASLRHSIAPSYYSDPEFSGHSRGGSTTSTVPLIPSVPVMKAPQSRFVSRKPPPAGSGLNPNGLPARPSYRPPTMDFAIMEN